MKRLLSLMLSFAVILAGCAVQGDWQEAFHGSPPASSAAMVSANRVPVVAFYGRGLLPTKERIVYDMLDRSLRDWRVGETIAFSEPISRKRFEGVWSAIMNDHPEFFWAACSVEELEGMLASFQIGPAEGVSLSAAKQRQLEIDAAADRLLEGIGGSEFDIVTGVHDAVLRTITYEQDVKLGDAGSLYGGLVLGRGVCDAYSRTFQYLLQKKGIAVCYIRGTSVRGIPHSWNAVLLEGDWYYVDTTWDDVPDEKGYLYHDYLLVTLEELSLDHFPEAGQYDRIPEAVSDRLNYYRVKGYFADSQKGEAPVKAMGDGFARQLADKSLSAAKQPVFLELKVLGTYEAYQGYRELFDKQIFRVLRAVELALKRDGIPISIDTTGSIEYDYNENTQVLTLFPNASRA